MWLRKPTVLLVCFLKYRLVFQQLLNLGEQYIFLVVMVRLDKLEPGEAVANKIGLVLVGYERRLVVDRIVAAKDRVVWNTMSVRRQGVLRGPGLFRRSRKRTQQGHMCCS
jgi:hypothetical protein